MNQLLNKWFSLLVGFIGDLPAYYIWIGEGLAVALLMILVLSLVIKKRKKKKARPEVSSCEEIPEPPMKGDSDTILEQAETAEAEKALHARADAESLIPEKSKEERFLGRLKSGLSKTRNTLSGGLNKILAGGRKLDDEMMEELEELLITSDIGVETSLKLVEEISREASQSGSISELKGLLKSHLLSTIRSIGGQQGRDENGKPRVIMVVGVNGVGKTTTIGKLAMRFTKQGRRVLVVAADTFRAAAAEQLGLWAEKAGADIVRHKDNSDPAAVAYDGIEAAMARGVDLVLVDTAGRLHTKVNLMEELKKMKRTMAKKLPGAPHEIMLVLDATTGQNALSQAKLFNEALEITGLTLTKLDGTAKGGIAISICSSFNIPLSYIGVGEKAEDLQEFNPEFFVDALF